MCRNFGTLPVSALPPSKLLRTQEDAKGCEWLVGIKQTSQDRSGGLGLTLNVVGATRKRRSLSVALSSRINCGGINEHDRDVVLNRVNTAAGAAFQPLITFSQGYWFLAKRADEHVEKILRHHSGYIIAGSKAESSDVERVRGGFPSTSLAIIMLSCRTNNSTAPVG